MSMTANPPIAQFPAAGGKANTTLGNAGTTRLVFKVKSSNNTEYRLKPVFGFVDPGATASVEVTRLAGPPKEDKLVIQYANAPDGASDAQATFTSVQPEGTITIPMTAA